MKNWYVKLFKIASSQTSSFLKQKSEAGSDNQTANDVMLFDVKRYNMDSYSIRISISKTEHQHSVALVVNNEFMGGLSWNAFWVYGLDEFSLAKKTYLELNEASKETLTKMVNEEVPTSVLCSMIKSSIEKVDPEGRVASNIPSINYARRYPTSPDWRENIYGKRYPNYQEKSYRQEKSNKGL